jgi:multiple sugar transport system ATP-binding protein
MNIFRTRLSKDEQGTWTIDVGGRSMTLRSGTLARYHHLDRYLDRQILVGIRPEAFAVASDNVENSIIVDVKTVEALGHETIVHATAAIDFIDPDEDRSDSSSDIQAPDERQQNSILTARVASSRALQIDRQLTLQVDTNQLYLFASDGDRIE